MANEIYDSTWWGNTRQTASSIGTSTEMIQGQFNLTKIGDELVTNGDFSNGLNGWTDLSSWWSVVNNEAYHPASTSMKALSQEVSTEVNKQYKITIDANIISGTPQVFWDKVSGQQGQSILQGTNEIIVTTFKTNSKIYFGRFSPTNAEFYIDNVSVKEVRATTVEASKCLADAIHRIGLQDIQN